MGIPCWILGHKWQAEEGYWDLGGLKVKDSEPAFCIDFHRVGSLSFEAYRCARCGHGDIFIIKRLKASQSS